MPNIILVITSYKSTNNEISYDNNTNNRINNSDLQNIVESDSMATDNDTMNDNTASLNVDKFLVIDNSSIVNEEIDSNNDYLVEVNINNNKVDNSKYSNKITNLDTNIIIID